MSYGWRIERCEEGELIFRKAKRRTQAVSAPQLYTAGAMEGNAKTIGGDLQVSPILNAESFETQKPIV